MMTVSIVINNHKQVFYRKAVRIDPLGKPEKGQICTYELYEGRKLLGYVKAEYGDAKDLGIAMMKFQKEEDKLKLEMKESEKFFTKVRNKMEQSNGD